MPPIALDRRLFLSSLAAPLLASEPDGARDWEWRVYGADPEATRYAPIDQITRENVGELKPAWTHRCGDHSNRPQTTMETTPIVVDGTLYLLTPRLKLRALDAATGELKWEFDHQGGRKSRRSAGIGRGVTYWKSERGDAKRIFFPVRSLLYSVDAETGELDPAFGEGGKLDLKHHLDHDMEGLSFNSTSPPVVWRDLVIVGGGGGEGPWPAAPGHIRAFDARTGERRWIFHTVPRPGQYGYETWPEDAWKRVGGTNNWAGMSLDTKRGWVFASLGSPAFDYYGGDRKGQNLFGNCVLALNAETGERMWHYQVVHHDIWDYDLPAQPALITVERNGRRVDAVAQVTKQSFVFLLDRDTGQPMFPVEETPTPPSQIPGEETWPTQPIPQKPPPLSRTHFTRNQVTNISPKSQAKFTKLYDETDVGPLYEPTTKRGTLVHPGFRGGALWGGCSFDPERNLLIVKSDENTNRITLAEAKENEPFEYNLSERTLVRDANGYPMIKPPWGYLTAIDCDEGDFAWRVVHGEYPELAERGIPKTGTPSHGGSICTKGGLTFMAGRFDRKMRAFDSETGETLWEYQLEAGGFATPCTYMAGGKQYVVIAAGGGKGDSPSGDAYVAFSLG